jgi:hypothetical protein
MFARARASLEHVDATLTLFAPDAMPELILPSVPFGIEHTWSRPERGFPPV